MPDWIEVSWRTILAIVVLYLMTRLLGKRQITQLTYFEYITGITIGSIAATTSLDVESLWYHGLVALSIWALFSLGIEYLTLKSKHLRNWIEGKGTIFIKDGKILEDNLKKARYNTDELLEQLRKNKVFQVADVEFAVLETSGNLSILLKKENQPLTAKHLGIKVAPEQEPQAVILDGNIMDEPLSTIGLNREWLHTELEKIGVTQENVFLGQVDAYGQLFVDLYDDQLKVPTPSNKELLYAVLKKCEADLELFASSTKNKQAKHMYMQCAAQMEQVVTDLKPILTR